MSESPTVSSNVSPAKALPAERVADELVLAKGSVRVAAKSLGVSWQAMYRRMAKQDVQGALDERLRSETTALAIESITVLGSLMRAGRTEATRRMAAEALLDRAVPRTQARKPSLGTAVNLTLHLSGQSTNQPLESPIVTLEAQDVTDPPCDSDTRDEASL